MKDKKRYTERSVYFFDCIKCKKEQCRTYYKRNRTLSVCRKCRGRRNRFVAEGQTALLLDNGLTYI